MLSFRQFLAEAFIPSQPAQDIDARPSGWLAPDGRYYGLRSYNNHGRWAMAMGTDLRQLMRQGWMRVTMSRANGQTTIYTNNPDRSMTARQLRALKDAAIEFGWAALIHDNDEDDRVVWNNPNPDDTLADRVWHDA